MKPEELRQDSRFRIVRRLACIQDVVQDIDGIKVISTNEARLTGYVFDIAAVIVTMRKQFLMHGTGWDELQLEVCPKKPYRAALSVSLSKEESNNQLKFKIKIIDEL